MWHWWQALQYQDFSAFKFGRHVTRDRVGAVGKRVRIRPHQRECGAYILESCAGTCCRVNGFLWMITVLYVLYSMCSHTPQPASARNMHVELPGASLEGDDCTSVQYCRDNLTRTDKGPANHVVGEKLGCCIRNKSMYCMMMQLKSASLPSYLFARVFRSRLLWWAMMVRASSLRRKVLPRFSVMVTTARIQSQVIISVS